MVFNWKLIGILLITICTLQLVDCNNDIRNKIYHYIEHDNYCFRRMNLTHQIGCQSKEGGNVGVIHLIENETDINYVTSEGTTWPYIAVLPVKYFTLTNLVTLKNAGQRVSGVLVLNDNNPSEKGFSPESQCPNENFGLYTDDPKYGHCKAQKWITDDNPGANMMYYDWPFPVFMIRNQTDIEDIKKCFHERNTLNNNKPNWPLCAAQLTAPMFAAKNSHSCINRNNYFSLSTVPQKYCDPLGGTNIFSTLFPTVNSQEVANRSVAVLASRLDSFSMFDTISPGADSAVTSLVTLLSVAHSIQGYLEEIRIKQSGSPVDNVLFALFDGEAFDYIGSTKTIYDMLNDRFPVVKTNSSNLAQLKLNHISHFIELNQLAIHDDASHSLWIHNHLQGNKPAISLTEILLKYSRKYKLNLNKIAQSAPLPPSSVQNFLREDKEIGGIVISNHEKQYTNKFYNSFLDDYDNINRTENIADHLVKVVSVVTASLFELLTGKPCDGAKEVNKGLITDLLECYLNNAACDPFKYVTDPNKHFNQKEYIPAYPTYVSVFHGYPFASRAYTHMILANLTGEDITGHNVTTRDACYAFDKQDPDPDPTPYNYYWISGSTGNGSCIKSQAIATAALSPAFQITEDSLYVMTSDASNYSTWTESQWQMTSVRLFLKSSPLQEWLTFITGIVILLSSFGIVYFIQKKSSILFQNECDRNSPERNLTVDC